MPIGMEAYNAQGQLIFGETSYAGRFFGTFTTNNLQTGSITDARLIGLRLAHFLPQNVTNFGGPKLTLNPSNGQVTWLYEYTASGGGNPPTYPNEIIYYGGY